MAFLKLTLEILHHSMQCNMSDFSLRCRALGQGLLLANPAHRGALENSFIGNQTQLSLISPTYPEEVVESEGVEVAQASDVQ